MDNATHAFVGLAVGELIHRLLPEEENTSKNSTRRALLLFMCTAASNFPDLDLVLYPLLEKPLGYLLHHRGHSHTFLWEIPQALLLVFGTLLLWPNARRLVAKDGPTRLGLAITVILGFILHISMDFLNSYGVHPFAPFDKHWYFGDMVFIIEPIFWATMGVAAVMTFKNKWLKYFWLLFLLGIPTVATVKEFLPLPSLIALLGVAGAIMFVQARSKPRDISALAFSILVGFIFVIAQGFASTRARASAKALLEQKDSGFQVLDVAASSFPSNPLCWSFTSIAVNESSGLYRLRNGIVSLKPDFLSVSQCSPGMLRERPLNDISQEIAYFSETDGDLKALRDRNQQDCHFNAWMRFARMPLMTAEQASDYRFAIISARGNFTALRFENFKNRECPDPGSVPDWIPPRQDLLGQSEKLVQ